MKIQFEKDKIILYLKDQLKINKKLDYEEYLKKLFKKIKKIYNLEFKGCYLVNIYCNNYFGTILEIIDEKVDYYFNQIDMEIKIYKDSFMLYKLNYDYLNLKKINNLYRLNSDFYVKIDDKLNYIIEFGDIIYGDKALKIIKKCKKVNV